MRAEISCGVYFLPSISLIQSVPMWRLTDRIVRSTFVTACRFATSPTSGSPLLANATTDGVVRAPSAFAMTVGSPPSRTATTEFVVPRSMPTARAMCVYLLLRPGGSGVDVWGTGPADPPMRPILTSVARTGKTVESIGLNSHHPVQRRARADVPDWRDDFQPAVVPTLAGYDVPDPTLAAYDIRRSRNHVVCRHDHQRTAHPGGVRRP